MTRTRRILALFIEDGSIVAEAIFLNEKRLLRNENSSSRQSFFFFRTPSVEQIKIPAVRDFLR
ncbi:hypothetical protein DLM75_11905 [Leptospira stimsonii]|uniref:Uncharacterized protein n=1 Tax=Leptospira stimsonii TaxID=2202203 RepID=A0A396Z7S7_9LEPT|nr:hypothetical protein DLM75_11905 [Leptospira stimsonii]